MQSYFLYSQNDYSYIYSGMEILKNKFLQFILEALLIAMLGYLVHQFVPSLPWWIIVLIAGVVAFVLNTSARSFFSGFIGVALLWGVLAWQLSSANMDILATRMGELFSQSNQEQSMEGISAMQLIVITALLGGLLGGLGAMTGSYGRKLLAKEEK